MGMFDYLHYDGHEYQTKDTPDQGMEHYEIRGNELWYKRVEREWVSSQNSWFGGYFEEVSHEWIFLKDFDGKIRFYREDKENGGWKKSAWIEYEALFMNGKIIKFTKIQNGA